MSDKTWYRVGMFLERVEVTCPPVVRETNKTISYMNERWQHKPLEERERKIASSHRWFDDLPEARSFALAYIDQKIHSYNERLAALGRARTAAEKYDG